MFNRIRTSFLYLFALATLTSTQAQAVEYCASRSQSAYYEWISSVTVNGSTFPSGSNITYSMSPMVMRANVGSNSIRLFSGYAYSLYPENWAVFIDLNQDGIFSADEKVFSGVATNYLIGNFNVPATAKNGRTRMRVSMKYGSQPQPCETFYYGEVEDYNIDISGGSGTAPTPVPTPVPTPLPTPVPTPVPTPPPATATVSMLIGFDQGYGQNHTVVAKFMKFGILYSSSNFFYAGSAPSRVINLEVDQGSTMEWYAYADANPSVKYLPSTCSQQIVSNTCVMQFSTVQQTALFKQPPPPATLPSGPIQVDQLLNFDGLFGGATYKPGPSVVIDGVTFATTNPYFYNQSGAPFNSAALGFGNVAMTFPAQIQGLSFQASGMCTNCVQTVQVKADGVLIGTFNLSYNTISTISIPLATPATKIEFNQNMTIDNLGIDYK